MKLNMGLLFFCQAVVMKIGFALQQDMYKWKYSMSIEKKKYVKVNDGIFYLSTKLKTGC